MSIYLKIENKNLHNIY